MLQKQALLVFKISGFRIRIVVFIIAPGFIETEMTAKLNEDVVKDGENSIKTWWNH
jgi:NAD(P)-dependent dehydrogenase (short-subunit alcohol dehydrogenase family)